MGKEGSCGRDGGERNKGSHVIFHSGKSIYNASKCKTQEVATISNKHQNNQLKELQVVVSGEREM